jgi:catechol 2,3-dioxygenase-like lactoylglutathione lyase family enzyme
MNQNINNIGTKATANLTVGDMAKTVDFYRGLLGFEVTMNIPEEPPYAWCNMKNGGVEIMFQTKASIVEEYPDLEDVALGGSFSLFIEVKDINTLYSNVKGKVGFFKDMNKTFYGMWEFAVKDPDGYLLIFAQPAE